VLAPYVDEGDLARSAEWLARILLSHVLDPSPFVDLSDPTSVRLLVTGFFLPGLRRTPAVDASPKGHR
jgi:hypothetical protein